VQGVRGQGSGVRVQTRIGDIVQKLLGYRGRTRIRLVASKEPSGRNDVPESVHVLHERTLFHAYSAPGIFGIPANLDGDDVEGPFHGDMFALLEQEIEQQLPPAYGSPYLCGQLI
jgi:hypothetical protein